LNMPSKKKNRKKRKNSKAQQNAQKFDQIAQEKKIESKQAHKPSELAQTLTQEQTAKINKEDLNLVETPDSILENLEDIAPVTKAKEKLSVPDGGGAEDNNEIPKKSEIEELEDLGRVKQFFERRSSQTKSVIRGKKVVKKVVQRSVPAPIQEHEEIIVAKSRLDKQRSVNRVELEKEVKVEYVEPPAPDSPIVHAVMNKETSLDDLGIAAATPVTRDDFDPLDNIDDIMQSQTSSESPQPVVTVLSQLKTDSVPNPPTDEPPAIVDEESDVEEFDEPDDDVDEQSPMTPLEAYEIIEPQSPAEIVEEEEEVFEEFGEDFEVPDDTPAPVVVNEEAEKEAPIELIEEEEDYLEFGEDFEVPDEPVIVEREADKEEAKEEEPQEIRKEEPQQEPVIVEREADKEEAKEEDPQEVQTEEDPQEVQTEEDPQEVQTEEDPQEVQTEEPLMESEPIQEEAPIQEIEQEVSEPISKEVESSQPVREISATSLPAVIPEVSQPEEVEMEKTTSVSPVLSSETNLDDLEDEQRVSDILDITIPTLPIMEEINLAQEEPVPKTKELERRVSFKEDQNGEVVKDLLQTPEVDAKITIASQESKQEDRDPLKSHGAASQLLRTMFGNGEFCV